MRQDRQLLPVNRAIIIERADVDEDQKVSITRYEPTIGNQRTFDDCLLEFLQDMFRLRGKFDRDDNDATEAELGHVEPCIIAGDDAAFLHDLAPPCDRTARKMYPFSDDDIGRAPIFGKRAEDSEVGIIEREFTRIFHKCPPAR